MARIIRLLLLILLLPAAGVFAQEATEAPEVLPTSYRLNIVDGEYQGWNNCGPATVTNALKYFGYADNQRRAASWLKPNGEDKNVSPWQMVKYVNTQVPEIPVFALNRVGGDLQLLKTLLYHNFPVIIEEGYDPETDPQGWMGHYLLLIGYDDSVNVFMTHDSYIGPNTNYTYDHIDEFWQHFNRTFIVIYEKTREPELMELLGKDADPYQNTLNALEEAQAEATANGQDAFAWFNIGTNLVSLELYDHAAVAYDQARKVGLPWRMLWYQFGPYEAYLNVGRYDDVIALASATRNDGGGHYVEETFYYAGLAREGKGEIDRAVNNYTEVLNFNPNFEPAREARDRLTSSS